MGLSPNIDELYCNALQAAFLAHTALNDAVDAQPLSDFFGGQSLVAERERRRTSRDAQRRLVCDDMDYLFREAVTDVVLVAAAGHVDERQHRDAADGR